MKNDISKVEKEIKEKEDRLNELDELLADPAVSTNSAKLNEISKEQNEISERLDETYGSMGDFYLTNLTNNIAFLC